NCGNRAFVFKELLNWFQSAHHLFLHREHLAFEAIFADGKDSLFYFVEQIVHLVLLLVGAAHALSGGGNDFPQNVLVANDLQVVLHVRRSWNESEKAGDERRAAYAVKQVAITQYLGERDQIDCLSCIPKID